MPRLVTGIEGNIEKIKMRPARVQGYPESSWRLIYKYSRLRPGLRRSSQSRTGALQPDATVPA